MPRRVFVDTSAWLAVTDTSDVHHAEAVDIYTHLLDSQVVLVITILVIAETQIWLRRRFGSDAALVFLNNINESTRIEIVYPDAGLEKKAKQILRQFADQDFSLADAISFAWLKDAGLSDVFAYDQHFVTAGYNLVTR
ncbi:MAG: PIN domain-containing protein [Anaerolineales bacterium]|jgi:predicted nucleic acid-binding protein